MAKVTMLNMAGAEAGSIELNDAIFAIRLVKRVVGAHIRFSFGHLPS